jgi:hypothetical protein
MSRINRITIVVVIAAAAAAYAGTFDVPFQFDDVSAVAENATIRTLSVDALRPPANRSPTAGRPLVNLSLALNYAAGGLDVTGYHVVNLTLHIACALLVFALVRGAWHRSVRLQPDIEPAWFAGAIAIAWAVHPLNTGAVT